MTLAIILIDAPHYLKLASPVFCSSIIDKEVFYLGGVLSTNTPCHLKPASPSFCSFIVNKEVFFLGGVLDMNAVTAVKPYPQSKFIRRFV
jgi:hypothetical protein